MDFLEMIIISLQITNVFSKKYISSSDESIENLLYYKDCQHKPSTTTPPPVLRAAPTKPPQPDCPFPKMCCTMSCGNECGNQQSFVSRQMQPLQQSLMQPAPPRQPQIPPVQPQLQRGRKKKIKQQPLIPPIGGRRDFGFTRERIKSLISQDQDIKKILKDLVRVTMQKVDLVDMMKAKPQKSAEGSRGSDEYE